MSISRTLNQLLLLTGLWLLLAGCENSTGTVANPNLNTGDSGYTGPAARTADIRSFQLNFWDFLKEDNRCGQCHSAPPQAAFVDTGDVNAAYSVAFQYVSLIDPASSAIVAKARTGHNCWLGQSAGDACASNIEQMIVNWAMDSNVTSARQIQLTPPAIKNPGDAKSFPASAFTPGTAPGNSSTFATTVHPILVANCQNCHIETATPLPIAPFFANNDEESAYDAAKPKMDIDTPSNSRFVLRLRQESHNCWTNCVDDANTMEAAIANFAGGIEPTEINPLLITSKALNLADGIVAAGGNRHESNQIALWEFTEGTGSSQAFDTSGIDPSITLQLYGAPQWLGGYGLNLTNSYAAASNNDSVKLKTFIESTGEYAIEAWVVPANVTQQNANIIGYSGGSVRNFTLGQEMYNYEFYNRVDDPAPLNLNGEPFLTTGDSNQELLQSSLQHVVANYDPIAGRSVYINGSLVEDPMALGVSLDPITAPTAIGNVVWDDNLAFVIGADVSGVNNWDGQIRLVAIHNRTLTPAQILQNFDVGVGERFFLLFWVGHYLGEVDTDPRSFILFEVSQFDDYSYLFSTPRFINLDPNWIPTSISIKGMRIGINGKEAFAGQAYANIDTTINATDYGSQLGQLLSPLGTVIALEKSAATDEFFLTFEDFDGNLHAFADPPPSPPPAIVDPATPVVSDIGVRTFEEISATISAITGIPVNDTSTFDLDGAGPLPPTLSVKDTYDSYIQQLPTVEAIDAFLPSHQMAIAQLALASCNTLVETDPGYFAPFVFGAAETVAFDNATKRSQVVDPLLTAITNMKAGVNLTAQPLAIELRDSLGSTGQVDLVSGKPGNATLATYDSLISQLVANCTGASCGTSVRTDQIVKAVCAAAVGGAVMLVQ